MPKRTLSTKIGRAKRKQGFLSRMHTKDGRAVLKRRRNKGRARLVTV